MNITKPVQTQLEPAVVFIYRNDGTVYYCVEQLKMNIVSMYGWYATTFINKVFPRFNTF